eukprot:2559457-Pleurochrysis_carterae.AAC.8
MQCSYMHDEKRESQTQNVVLHAPTGHHAVYEQSKLLILVLHLLFLILAASQLDFGGFRASLSVQCSALHPAVMRFRLI